MKDFIAEYCKKNEEKINQDLFDRTFDKPLVDYIVDTCKNLEVLPAITLKSWELVTDQMKIRSEVNKRLVKDPKIKNNKCLERLVSPSSSAYDLLVLNFIVKAKGQEAEITRKLRIPHKIDKHFYLRGGKKVLPLIQVVDNSTFVKRNVLNFKTTLYPIKLFTSRIKLRFIDDDSISVQKFNIDLFEKVTNPLYYYLALYGLEGTLEKFCLDRVMSITTDIIDEDNYMYLKVNNNIYLEIHEKAFYAHEFIAKFVGTLYDALLEDKSKATIKDVYSRDYWLGRLSEVFSKKRSVNKGERVLISYKKIMDPYTKARLKLRKFHKKNTATVVRWMMTNYEDLLKKDSNDLKNKRMRANETQAYFFDSYITRNVYSLLNTDNPPFEKYVRLLNSINEFTLIRSTHGGGKATPTSMFRYERYNDFDAIELSRFTLKGPTGLNGGKKKTSIRYRDIHPSHLGRYDLNVCSSSDPGLTGYLCANVQFDENGYFDTDNNEPDNYDMVIDRLIDRICEDNYIKDRSDLIKLEMSRGDDGFIQLKKKKSAIEWTQEFANDPWKYGLYSDGTRLRLIPKMERDAKGFIKLNKITPSNRRRKKVELERDENGFIILKHVITKMERQKMQERKRKKKK